MDFICKSVSPSSHKFHFLTEIKENIESVLRGVRHSVSTVLLAKDHIAAVVTSLSSVSFRPLVCLCVCVCVCVCVYLILFPTPRTVNKHERSRRKGELGCVEISMVNFLLFSWLPMSSSADNSSFPLTFPTSCLPACPIQQELPAFAWAVRLSSLVILLWCYSFLISLCLDLLFPAHGPSQNDYGVYTGLLPSLILFFILEQICKYSDSNDLSHIMAWFHCKKRGKRSSSLPTCLKVNGPVQWEGVCEQSLWLHHTPLNHSTVLHRKTLFCLFHGHHARTNIPAQWVTLAEISCTWTPLMPPSSLRTH